MHRKILAFLIIGLSMFTLSACDMGGNDPRSDSEPLTLTAASSDILALEPGRLLLLDVEGITLQSGYTYLGRIGEIEL